MGYCVHIHPEYDVSAPMSQAALKLEEQLSYSDWWLIRMMSVQPITMTFGYGNIAPLNVLADPSWYIPIGASHQQGQPLQQLVWIFFFLEANTRISALALSLQVFRPKCGFARWNLHLVCQEQASVYSILGTGNTHNLNVYQLWIPWEYCAVFVSVCVSFIHYEWRGSLGVFVSWMSAGVLCVLCHIWMTGVYKTTSKLFNVLNSSIDSC